ncbi:hypothetical protein Selin_1443 [Desulfurispirillum indicum S5]|uniref:Uncharacterized protein n=1 Tax=Desulfurispirillum indicum (strain ATCC BAA-1389 / DSM 22839 / S5) TaxID=653733 RepID=E6W6T4_DESIS|nr:hypothetical protein [Desulfurispirillum indicum]ADU66177.1 hypothetical protein Selin_1443 [Desulfurispirillum indicum S5]
MRKQYTFDPDVHTLITSAPYHARSLIVNCLIRYGSQTAEGQAILKAVGAKIDAVGSSEKLVTTDDTLSKDNLPALGKGQQKESLSRPPDDFLGNFD